MPSPRPSPVQVHFGGRDTIALTPEAVQQIAAAVNYSLENGGGIPPEAEWKTFTICNSGSTEELQILTRPVPIAPLSE